MKKIFLAIVAILSVGIAAAQVELSSAEKPSIVCSGYLGFNDLVKYKAMGEDHYFLSLDSDNQFDQLYSINLGKKKDAIDFLSKLIDIFSPEANLKAKDSSGNPFRIFGSTASGDRRYLIKKDGYAGYAHFRLSEIKKFIKALESE